MIVLHEVTPLLRETRPAKQKATRLCFRCGGRFEIASGGFGRHDQVCLQRAIESDARKRAQREPA